MRDELEEFAGGAFSINADATITLPAAHIQSSIGISPYAPRIDVFARIADDVTQPRHAESIVADMASTWPGIQLVLDDTELHAAHLIDAETYSRDQLFAGLHVWFEFIDRGLPEIHRRLHPEPRRVAPISPVRHGSSVIVEQLTFRSPPRAASETRLPTGATGGYIHVGKPIRKQVNQHVSVHDCRCESEHSLSFPVHTSRGIRAERGIDLAPINRGAAVCARDLGHDTESCRDAQLADRIPCCVHDAIPHTKLRKTFGRCIGRGRAGRDQEL
ncbi:T3SS (YopN, CesT) and YbjN peptide-binding chaperone 1 [Gordonia rhizosphera]|uniref:T3SS (YopN, CesT) and YbjN peptide-binding chaperone 1 n=1 Tax=Gordonia rhizosphera TaxID=83341 RepID=UPI00357134A3